MPPSSSTTFWRDLGKTFVVNTLIGLGLTLMQVIFRGMPSRFWAFLIANQMYAHAIGSVGALVMPRVAMRVDRMPPLRRWTIYITTLVAGGLAGTALATLGTYVAGITPAHLLARQFVGSSVIAVVITLVIGISAYLFESLKGRFEETTIALRDKQLQHERALKLAAEAQFSSLQSRLQPHFLFNTINSVLSLIREDPAGAEAMLQRLSRLLRFTLDTQQRASVTLREEVRLVSDYLEIEQGRFGERLRYELLVDRALDEMEVPPFSIQTLVENSMKYAIATRREGGTVRVRAWREGDRLQVEVTDDGPGFGYEAMSAGHGLDTLARRLESLHGAAGRLEIESGGGGLVRFSVPAAGRTA